MRSALQFAVVTLTSILTAGPNDPKFVRLIGPDVWFVYSVDVERYRNSSLSAFFPLSAGGFAVEAPGEDYGVRQVIVAGRRGGEGRQPLTILRGTLSPLLASRLGDDHFVNGAFLDATTAILGDPDSVREATERWAKDDGDRETCPAAAAVKQLSGAYDTWFLLLKPLLNLDHASHPAGLRYREEFIQVIEDVRGGIRLGATNDFGLDITLKTGDDAMAAAGILRWAPGLLQVSEETGPNALIVELVEGLMVRAEGNAVSVSFSIVEKKLAELSASLQEKRKSAIQ